MPSNSSSDSQWRNLYEAAVKIKQLAPWEWMDESDVFGVQDPDTGKLGFVSVMGAAGEHFAAAVYLGAEGLYGFWDLQFENQESLPERVLEVPQLQASFEDREELDKIDRDLMKKLGFKFRGSNAYPMFRSIKPGFYPWHLEDDEIRILTHALEQTLDVAPRFRDDPSLLTEEEDDEDLYLVRVSRRENKNIIWEDQLTRVPPPEPSLIPIPMNLEELENLKRLPPSGLSLEIDFFMLPSPVAESKGDRPFFPYMLLMVDAVSGMILGTNILKPDPTLPAMWGLIPMHVAHSLAQIGVIPKEIAVRSSTLLDQLLEKLALELNIKIKSSTRLRSLDQAKDAFFHTLM